MPQLAYVEHDLPGTPAERRALAQRLDLGLEVANRPELDVPRLLAGRAKVTCVQAWGLHDVHPLHPDPSAREAAEAHVRDSIDLAVELGAPRVLAVCGFGHAPVDAPFERCLDFFGRLASAARERGLRLLLEPLSSKRAGAMTDLGEFQRLLVELGNPDVFATVLDTGHLLDGGHEPSAVLAAWQPRLEEVQLRGLDSAPPSADWPIASWLAPRSQQPDVLAIEHARPLTIAAVEALVSRLRGAFS
jgi:sugar phosphate isomerase/epimerase